MKIILMRHGRPKIDLNSIYYKSMSSAQMGNIIKAYKNTDLDLQQNIPEKSQNIAKTANYIFSSNILRAQNSAKLLSIQKIHSDAIFAESDHPYFNWHRPNLFFIIWAVAYRIMWYFGFRTNGEAIKSGRKRAAIAAKKLEVAAIKHEQIIMFGHGIINHLIANALKKMGWQSIENSGHDYWSYIMLEKPAPQAHQTIL